MMLNTKKSDRQIIRYRTHSCLEPSHSRKIVRYPGHLAYHRRCAIIATRLKRREARKKKTNWLYHRLLLPPKVSKRKESSKRNHDFLAHHLHTESKTKPNSPRSIYRVNRASARRLLRDQGYFSERLRYSDSWQISPNDVGGQNKKGTCLSNELEPMPLNEWKIVLNKKDQEESRDCFDKQEHKDTEKKLTWEPLKEGLEKQDCDVSIHNREDSYGVKCNEDELELLSIEQRQYMESEFPNSVTDHSVWNFPILPTSVIMAPLKLGMLCHQKYPFQRKVRKDAFSSFEVLAQKINLQPRPGIWKKDKTSSSKYELKEPKVNVIDLSLCLPPVENNPHETNFSNFSPKRRSDIDDKNQDMLFGPAISSFPNDKVVSSHNIKEDEYGAGSDPAQNMGATSHNPIVRKLLGSNKWSSRPLSTKSAPVGNKFIGRHNQIVKNIAKSKQWTGRPQTSNTLSANQLDPSSATARCWSTEEEEEDESLFADEKPKPQKRKKKSGRKKKKQQEQERELSAKTGPLESATDLLDDDIFAELLKLYTPRDSQRNSATNSKSTFQRKKKRKRSGSKKKEDMRKALREDILVSLRRNTAYWFEVTSRLQTVSGKSEPKAEEDIIENAPSSKGKKNLRAAVHKAFPKLDRGKQGSSIDTASVPLSPKLPLIDQKKPPSKFYRAAAAVVNAERNYYNFLPPLNASWSEALEDLFPAVGQDSEDSGLGGEKKAGKKKSKRGGKKKGEEGGLDDPGQTAVSTVSDSRAGSSKRSSGSPHSSKPTSARSSKSSSAHRRMHDPLSYDPKQFLGDNNPPEDESELAKLQEALGGGGSTTLTESEVFWFHLPRSPSHRAAVFTLPVQIKRLRGLGTVDYLKKYMRLRTSRRQLHSMVFTKHRDLESIRIERLLTSDFGKALGDALGGELSETQLEKLTSMVPLPEEAMDKDFFVLIAAFAERLFCYDLLAAKDVEIEPRDLVEQLDFQQLDERLEEVTLDPLLHRMLTTIRDLG
ncbi:uncharacterized protein [Macrobrachium rosenbergii]|uniref:uncharacterized protein isoform X1 n=1 Tax=Macrobrachium rosenbergii TaxID=79674 RepID=UPI0034D6E0B2